MAVLSSSRSFDYRNIIWMVSNETVLTQTATRYEVTGLGPSGQIIEMLVTGTGFVYSNGSLTGGVSQTLVVTLDGQPYFQMTGTGSDLDNNYFDGGYSVDGIQLYGIAAIVAASLTGNDTVEGSPSNDTLAGFGGNDVLQGGAGSDLLIGGAGNDTLLGGAILDRTNYTDLNITNYSTSTSGVNVNLATGIAQDGLGGTDTLQDINVVQGSAFNDILTGSSTFNLFEQFEGMAGNDTIDGGAIDPITGSNSNRVSYHNAPSGINVNLGTGTAQDGYGTTDTLVNINHVRGSNFNDVLTGSDSTAYTEAFEGRAGNDTIDGKGGTDQVRYDPATSGVNVNLATGTAQDGQGGTDTLLNIEGVRGSNHNDVLTGGNPANGSGATDGFEFFQGNAGNDTIDGGTGYDRVDYFNSTSAVNVTLGGTSTGTAQDGLGGTDTLINIEAVRGSDFNDILTGSDSGVFESFEGRAGNDTIDGKGGIDRVDYSGGGTAVNVNLATGIANDGYGGTDRLYNIERVRGSAFDDTLVGGAENDTLEGNGGDDTLTGGGGNDNFLYSGPHQGVDLITDFSVGDTMQVRMLLSPTTPTSGNGSAVTDKKIQVSSTAGVTTLYVDTDNVAGADGQIQLTGIYNAADFTVVNTAEGYTNITYSGTIGTGGAISGTAGADSLVGGNGADTLIGLTGNDYIEPGAGADSVEGGDGDDYIQAADGSNDTIDGGAGNDVVSYYFGSSTSALNFTVTDNGTQPDGLGGTDTLLNVEEIHVFGGSANDVLVGNAQRNWLMGNGGDDTLTGGAGNDSFAFNVGQSNGTDRITDFAVGDELAFQGLSVTTITAGDNAAALGQGSVLVGAPSGGVTKIYVGTDSVAGADLIIDLQGSYAAADFALSYSDAWGSHVSYSPAQLLTGTAGADSLVGGNGADTLIGLDGNDSLNGGNGNDYLDGGPANDQLRGDAGNDTILGGDGNDYITGGSGDDSIVGGDGVDTSDYFYSDTNAAIFVNLSTGTVTGGNGNDTLSGIENVNGSNFDDVLIGDVNNNFLQGQGGNDTLNGGASNDTLLGEGGNDSLLGEAGSDHLVGGPGNDTLIGGAILDRTNYTDLNSTSYSTATSGVNVNLATGTAQDGLGGTDSLQDINFVQGSNFNDTLTGSSTFNLFEQFDGGAGNDTIDGGAIDPIGSNSNRATYVGAPAGVVVNLGTGTALDGYGSTDTLININHVRGSNFNDVLIGSDTTAYTETFEGRAGNDTIDGKGGTDQVRYDAATSGVNVNLATGTAQDGQGGTDTLLNIEGIRGSNYNDVLTGGNPANGSGATDGFEFFQGNAGNDTIDGGTGYDRVDYQSSTTAVNVTLGGTGTGTAQDGFGGTDSLINIEAVRGSNVNDTLTGSDSAAFESFEGRAGDDTIDGRGGVDRVDYRDDTNAVSINLSTGIGLDGHGSRDTLLNIENVRGSAHNDTLIGDAGHNHLEGLAGNDVLEGGASNDTLNGGSGHDTLTGGAGADVFVYAAGSGNGVDTIIDLGTGDRIHVGGATFTTAATTGDGSTVGINRMQIQTVAGITTLGIGTDSTAGADIVIRLNGTYTAANLRANGSDIAFNNIATGSVTITGTASRGQALSVTHTLADADGLGTVSYQWLANGSAITGATGTSLTLTNSHVGKTISVRASYTDGFGTAESKTSAATATVVITGTSASNGLTGTSGNETIYGLAGNDTLDGGLGNDTLIGGTGDDLYLVRTTGDVVIEAASEGTDTVRSYLGAYTLTANVENGRIMNIGAANMTGNNLNNVIQAGAGNNVINGGTGTDTASYDGGVVNKGVKVSLASTAAQATGDPGSSGTDTLISIENLIGSIFADQLTGNSGNNRLEGGSGNDILDGGSGNDSLIGGTGNDLYLARTTGDVVTEAASAGTDTAHSYLSAYTLTANVENGRIMNTGAANMTGNSLGNLIEAGVGNNVINGGSGTDTVSYAVGVGSTGVKVSLASTAAQATGGSGSDTLIGIERLIGSQYADQLTGNTGANRLEGGAGNDTLDGGSGNDSLIGGTGNDLYLVRTTGDVVTEAASAGTDTVHSHLSAYTLGSNVENGRIMNTGAANMTGNSLGNLIEAGKGNNVINGGTGTDTVSYAVGVGSTGVKVSLASTAAQATGGSGSDTLIGIERLIGSQYADQLTGNTGANRLEGGAGNDTLSGGSGNDTLVGGAGKDAMTGGTGNDIFDFNALSELGLGSTTRDVITDFTAGQDKIDLSTIDARSTVSGDQAFTFVSSFTTTAGQVRYSGGIVYLNTDTDTAAEFAIQLTGTIPASLTAASFVL